MWPNSRGLRQLAHARLWVVVCIDEHVKLAELADVT